MRNPPVGNLPFVQAFNQNAVDRCLRNSSRMCNFFTCYSAVFLQDLEHTFHTLVINRRSGSSWFRVFSMLNLPSRKRWAQREIVLRSTVSIPHTSISELWISVGVFPRNVSILMYVRWSSIVTVPESRTAAISTSFPRAHTPGDKLHCTSFQKFSSSTAEIAGQMASLFTQFCQRLHFFWDHPRTYELTGCKTPSRRPALNGKPTSRTP